MRTSLVLTVLGDDRPGLIESLSEVLEEHQGNWLDSRMVDLAGKFAGLLKVTVPKAQVDSLVKTLAALQNDGLNILAQTVTEVDELEVAGLLQLEVLGPDAPGIIGHITRQLSELKVNIQELVSEQRQAPMSGEYLFFARMTLELPKGISNESVQDALENLSDQLMVDLSFN